MAIKIVKHGHEPEPQKFAIEFKCPYCHCDFYADDTFDSIYKDYYTTAANFELRYACPELASTAAFEVQSESYRLLFMLNDFNRHYSSPSLRLFKIF